MNAAIPPSSCRDAVVIGGGFYGVVIAAYLVRRRGLRSVVLLERQERLLSRASWHNQARVHNGYHYPRSFTTAYRSRLNMSRFLGDWPEAVVTDFTKVYAIARRHSKVTAAQFERFCREIGAPLRPAGKELASLFDTRLVEAVYQVQEYAFNADRLREWAQRELADCGVVVACGAQALAVEERAGVAEVLVRQGDETLRIAARHVFNCTYSGLNRLRGDFGVTGVPLKHEIAELALVDLPPPLRGLGVTLMDGPFFSLMPFPARGLHTLTHVRYTPHTHWPDADGEDPGARLAAWPRESRVERMLRDAARYLPAVREARHVESLYEVKTVLQKNEGDDGRPILFESHPRLPGHYSILGGKIDNIYDVLEKLDAEPF